MPLLGEMSYRLVPDSLIRNQMSRQVAAGSPRLPDQFVDDFRAMTFESFKRSRNDSISYTEAHPPAQTLAAARVPLLVVVGAKDRIVNPASAAVWRRVAGATVDVMRRVGHTPQWERAAALAPLITRFARSHGAARCHASM